MISIFIYIWFSMDLLVELICCASNCNTFCALWTAVIRTEFSTLVCCQKSVMKPISEHLWSLRQLLTLTWRLAWLPVIQERCCLPMENRKHLFCFISFSLTVVTLFSGWTSSSYRLPCRAHAQFWKLRLPERLSKFELEADLIITEHYNYSNEFDSWT